MNIVFYNIKYKFIYIFHNVCIIYLGESYAGIYVPTLVMEIEKNVNSKNNTIPDLKGFALGNNCMGIDGMGGCNNNFMQTFVDFVYGHGQISKRLYDETIKLCGTSLIYGNWSSIPECDAMIAEGSQKIGGFNIYDIYDECKLENDPEPELNWFFDNKWKRAINGRQYFEANIDEDTDYNSPYACGGETVMNIYLNKKEVKTAINVPSNIVWKQRDGFWPKYTSTQTDLRPYYKDWILNGKYKILIYNGDCDTAVNLNGAEGWTTNLGFDSYNNENWRAWTIDNKQNMGGYVTIYNTTKNFTFLSIRGAGHMVPQFKPQSAFKMIQSFINDQPYPYYNP